MSGPKDLSTLRTAVQDTGFTPAVRDIAAVTMLLGDEDEAVARGAARAIARAAAGSGAVVLANVLRSLPDASPGVRAGAFRVVGRLAPMDTASAEVLIAGLADADARVQRSAAHALGRLRASEAKEAIAAALLHAWDEAPPLPLARALAEAMGKLGVVEAEGRLAPAADGDAELARITRQARAMLGRDTSRALASAIDEARASDFDVDLVLLCRGGLEDVLADEVRARVASVRSLRAGNAGSGQVFGTFRGALTELLTLRTALAFSFPLPPEPLASEVDLEAACARVLTSPLANAITQTWTRGPVRYRIVWQQKGHRRALTWRLVHTLAERAPRWVNDPTGSTWDVSVDASAGSVRVRLLPKKIDDARFVYRVRDVPAASHPTLAAALVRASRPEADDVVWDPFVGSGSELIERSKAGPYAALLGTDLDAKALAAAHANLEAASLRDVRLTLGDATTEAPRGVTRILTNPPMGRRVARDGSLADLLDRFIDHAATLLVPSGLLTWLSPLGGRTAARGEACGLRVLLRRTVDMGGFHAELQVLERVRR